MGPWRGPGGEGCTKKRRNNPMHWPIHRASRCRAKSKRSGLQCRAPAVRGSKVCRSARLARETMAAIE